MRCYKITEKTGDLVGFKLCDQDREILLITTEGIMIRMSLENISIIGRNASGVKLMNIDKDGDTTIASVAKVRESENDGEEDSEADPGEDADTEIAEINEEDTKENQEE